MNIVVGCWAGCCRHVNSWWARGVCPSQFFHCSCTLRDAKDGTAEGVVDSVLVPVLTGLADFLTYL